jgi:hypothetical protein
MGRLMAHLETWESKAIRSITIAFAAKNHSNPGLATGVNLDD